MKKIFYIIRRKNRGIYILNLESWTTLWKSLRFYRALSFHKKVLKYFFAILLLTFKPFSAKKNQSEVQSYLASLAGCDLDFNISDNCAAFVSPAGDKIIVNHFQSYIQKFAFKVSRLKVMAEIKAYGILRQARHSSFFVSHIFDIVETKNYCTFKLKNDFVSGMETKPDRTQLVNALVELFDLIPEKTVSFVDWAENLNSGLLRSKHKKARDMAVIIQAIKLYESKKKLRLGFEHGDFKVWNVYFYEKGLHIYDFEESSRDGMPLMDLINYYVDPLIAQNKSTDYILSFLASADFQNLCGDYLRRLQVDLSGKSLILIYFVLRASRSADEIFLDRYFDLANKALRFL